MYPRERQKAKGGETFIHTHAKNRSKHAQKNMNGVGERVLCSSLCEIVSSVFHEFVKVRLVKAVVLPSVRMKEGKAVTRGSSLYVA